MAGVKTKMMICLGQSNRDALFATRSARLREDNCVEFESCGGVTHTVSYRGAPLSWGGKRDAAVDLAPLIDRADEVRAGGGGFNSALHLACTGRRVALVDEVDLDIAGAALAGFGCPYLPVWPGREARVNVVIRNGRNGRRVCLRGRAPEAGSGEVADAARIPADVLLVNSARDPVVIEELIRAAETRGAARIVVANGSLPMGPRIELLLERSDLAIANLTEFCEVAAGLGVPCPSEEGSAELRDVAAAMVAVHDTIACGDLSVTLGERGCLALDAGAVMHAGVAARHRDAINRELGRRPGGVNGAGDIAAAAMAAAFAASPSRSAPGRAFGVARCATIEVTAALCPGLPVSPSWIEAAPVVARADRRRPARARAPIALPTPSPFAA